MSQKPEVPIRMRWVTRPEIEASIDRARNGTPEEAAFEVEWQKGSKSYRVIGYKSWRAMVEAEYGGTVPTGTSVPTCDDCGEPLTGRRDRRYCSSACRQRAHRKRQAEVSPAELQTQAADDVHNYLTGVVAAAGGLEDRTVRYLVRRLRETADTLEADLGA